MTRIFVIDSDRLFAECLGTTLSRLKNVKTELFSNALDAIQALEDESGTLPSLIFSEVLLPAANVFSFLNELISYSDSAKIPIVLVTNTNLALSDLKEYGIKAILKKEKLLPEEIIAYAERYTHKRLCD